MESELGLAVSGNVCHFWTEQAFGIEYIWKVLSERLSLRAFLRELHFNLKNNKKIQAACGKSRIKGRIPNYHLGLS